MLLAFLSWNFGWYFLSEYILILQFQPLTKSSNLATILICFREPRHNQTNRHFHLGTYNCSASRHFSWLLQISTEIHHCQLSDLSCRDLLRSRVQSVIPIFPLPLNLNKQVLSPRLRSNKEQIRKWNVFFNMFPISVGF